MPKNFVLPSMRQLHHLPTIPPVPLSVPSPVLSVLARIYVAVPPLLMGRECEISHLLTSRFGGFTRIATVGGWAAPDGTLMEEPATIWEVIGPATTLTTARLEEVARLMGALLNQEEVLVTTSPLTTLRSVRTK